MRDMPNRTGPLARAILDLLRSLPLRWKRLDVERLTGTEQEALKRLMRAGLVEGRIRLRACMDGFPQPVQMQVCVSGEYRTADVITLVFNAVPDWLDGKGQTRGRFRLESDGVVAVRLTDQGEEARHDYEHNSPETPSFVLAIVLGIGPMGLPRPRVEGSVKVESCRLGSAEAAEVQGETRKAEAQRPRSGAREAADSRGVAPASTSQATATVGDITVHNHLHLDQGAVVETVLKRLAEQQSAAPAHSLDEKHPASGTAPGAPEGKEGQSLVEKEPDEPLERLPDRVRRAYAQYLFATKQYEGEGGGQPTDRELYAWLKRRSEERLPAFETWVRYVRQARQALGEQKNSPRAGRKHGRSIVSCHHIEPPHQEATD